MKEGYWVNYSNGKSFEIDEHEQWLRVPGNAQRLGVPKAVVAMFKNFAPGKDRDKFLLFVMRHAPVMRVRGHGSYVAFEYDSRSRSGPLDAVWTWGKQYAGPFTTMWVTNFSTNEHFEEPFKDFEEAMERGGYDAVMRVASRTRLRLRRSVAAELAALAKELLSGA